MRSEHQSDCSFTYLMFFFVISIVPLFILLSKSLTLRPLPSWATEITLLSFFLKEFSYYFPIVLSLRNCRSNGAEDMHASKKKCTSPDKNIEDSTHTSVLDLPDLALESILGRLSAAGLCRMAGVCRSLRDLCWSDYLWERHMREKWGKVIGTVTQREWQRCLASRRDRFSAAAASKPRALFGSLSRFWPLSWPRLRLDVNSKLNSSLPPDSIASWYFSLESGKFWFPAQVYNREHEHAGFLLSCYDAELSYDCKRDTFNARYPPHGRRTIVMEEAVEWGRIRAPPIETPAHDLHISNCIQDLRPGDHIEIQWRRSKEFPYGWWYGVVGHAEACDQIEHFCYCQNSDTVVVEFKQYTPGSRWRRALINRKSHREDGNETDGFYGGVRKLCNEDEISTWRRLWPRDILE